MRIALIGLPGSGKSTVFRALTGAVGAADAHGGHLAVVEVPDPRTPRLAEVYGSRQVIQPEVTFLDLAALRRGEGRSGAEFELAPGAHDAEALAVVLQCFGELDSRGEPLDPAGDLEAVLLEMALADLGLLESRLQRLQAGGARREAHVQWEQDLLSRCHEQVAAGEPLSRLELAPDALKHLRGFTLLTLKPLLVICNVVEDDLAGAAAAAARQAAEQRGLPGVVFCASLEEEIAGLPVAEQAAFAADFGLEGRGRDRLITAAYRLLEIITFFTANAKEAHAWTLSAGATAWEAAGRVHTDLQQGFIRAEVTPFAALGELGSEKACREKGLIRLEGRDYPVADGDVLLIRFSR